MLGVDTKFGSESLKLGRLRSPVCVCVIFLFSLDFESLFECILVGYYKMDKPSYFLARCIITVHNCHTFVTICGDAKKVKKL